MTKVIENDPIIAPTVGEMKVRIIARKPRIDITVPMGDGPATPSGGFAGWSEIARPDDVAMTDWTGSSPLRQSLPLLLDRYRDGRSVERRVRTLMKLGRDAYGDEAVPPVFRVFGPVHFSGKHWVCEDIAFDTANVIRSRSGFLMRQPLTLSLMEYVPPGVVKIRKRRKRDNDRVNDPIRFTVGNYITREGDTLQKIAARELGKASRWREIAKLNPGTNDPNRELEPGRALRMP